MMYRDVIMEGGQKRPVIVSDVQRCYYGGLLWSRVVKRRPVM